MRPTPGNTACDTDVLIAGAGPTGLVLALWLTRLGVRVRLIDKASEPGTTSRALVVHARTLEFYREVGVADAAVERGLKFAAVNLWARGKHAGRIALGDIGVGLSPYPYLLIYPQDEHERLLIERLANMGVHVERRTALMGFQDDGDRIAARIKTADGPEQLCTAAYLAGCDGAHSAVRDTLQAGFPGGTYQHLFYVADVEASGAVMNGELHVALDEVDFFAVFPLSGEGRARLVGTVQDDAVNAHEALGWDDVSTRVLHRMRIEVQRVNWFSTYRVHHRVTHCFRKGRAFLLGDAAHIHSPVGGQGMNTGIGDAVNLAWKLAAVLRGRAPVDVLETYETERIAFAQRLVATTDRAFTLVTSDGSLARFVRLDVVPRLLPALFRLRAVRRYMFRTASQILVTYRGSALAAGEARSVRGGDRLPWVQFSENKDNFEPLTSLDWQVHVYGDVRPDLRDLCRDRAIALHCYAWNAACVRAGLERNAAYLIRPDGYVGLADSAASAGALALYLDTRGLRTFRGEGTTSIARNADAVVSAHQNRRITQGAHHD
jgi:2-polyprenyl-6-methoxyphenol hydroxylase-like FAD-dependent oxidoreductase